MAQAQGTYWARLKTFCYVLVAIMAVGCTTQQSTPNETAVHVEAPRERATRLLKQGDYAAAAALYQTLTAADAQADAQSNQLLAGLIYYDLGDFERALPLLRLAAETPATEPRRQLAQALLAESAKPEDALYQLNLIDPSRLTAFETGLFLRRLGAAQRRLGDPAGTLNLINAEIFPLPVNRRTELTHLIWEAITATNTSLTAKLDVRNPHLAGWFALRDAVSQHGESAAALTDVLAQWRLTYGSHPANEILIEEILEHAEELSAPLQRVALLLPLEGELAAYGTAVRDGFLINRFSARDLGLRVRVYAADGANAVAAYAQAAKDGAQLIVGPLDKPGIESLALLGDRKLPLLALNNISGAQADRAAAIAPFVMFGLAPEDEGENIAQFAFAQGHRRLAVMVPASELGTRVRDAFTAEWQRLGGTLVEESVFHESVAEYKSAIRKTFSLAQSEARASHLRRLLRRPISFVAKARTDVDAIMLVANPVSARQIIPQFRYLGVNHLPIITTSHVFDGGFNANADQDLDGITFQAMPWVLRSFDPTLRDALDRHWRRSNAADPLFALGIDAYRVAKQMAQVRATGTLSLDGATGQLTVGPNKRIKRALAWAVFRGGRPRLIPTP